MRGGQDNSLIDLLAIRLSLDAALLEIATVPVMVEFWPPAQIDEEELSDSTAIRYLLQLALEHSWERKVAIALSRSAAPASLSRPDVQAVFCIDVRSEIFRRALEASSPGIHTRGFAGFFGLPIEYRPMDLENGQAQCPVLLLPQMSSTSALTISPPTPRSVGNLGSPSGSPTGGMRSRARPFPASPLLETQACSLAALSCATVSVSP